MLVCIWDLPYIRCKPPLFWLSAWRRVYKSTCKMCPSWKCGGKYFLHSVWQTVRHLRSKFSKILLISVSYTVIANYVSPCRRFFEELVFTIWVMTVAQIQRWQGAVTTSSLYRPRSCSQHFFCSDVHRGPHHRTFTPSVALSPMIQVQPFQTRL